jgi:hypothetical protein
MELALTVVAVVIVITIGIGIVGVLIDRGTERHVNRGDRQ